MKRLLAIILFGMLIFGCTQNPASTTKNDSLSAQTPNKIVTIKDFAFNPSETIIDKGMTVMWINQDSVPHSIRFADGNQSDILAGGQNFSRRFMDSGDFEYSCGIHPSMKGKVKVLGTTG
jgi:plastocyanin